MFFYSFWQTLSCSCLFSDFLVYLHRQYIVGCRLGVIMGWFVIIYQSWWTWLVGC